MAKHKRRKKRERKATHVFGDWKLPKHAQISGLSAMVDGEWDGRSDSRRCWEFFEDFDNV